MQGQDGSMDADAKTLDHRERRTRQRRPRRLPVTNKDYTDYELMLEYKTVLEDSGIYPKGTPQVQIWDYTKPISSVSMRTSAAADSGTIVKELPGKIRLFSLTILLGSGINFTSLRLELEPLFDSMANWL